MKSQALQELVRKIFGDERMKQQFISNPDAFLSKFDLTEQEKKAMLTTHAKLGLVNADSPQLEAVIEADYSWFSTPP